AFPGRDPDALHLGQHLTAPVLQRAAAGAVAEVLRAAHRARQPRRVQDALSAHATVPHGLLRDPFDENEDPPEPGGRRRRLRGPPGDPGSPHLRPLGCAPLAALPWLRSPGDAPSVGPAADPTRAGRPPGPPCERR